jgi:hypothetical protein
MRRKADQPDVQPAKDETFLQRWSRRKLAAASDADVKPPLPATEQPAAPPASPAEEDSASGRQSPSVGPAAGTEPALPPLDSLTFESDFRAFLQPHVAEDVKRQALKKLLHDPRFNVMDGLDVYIDDYSVPSPLEPALARALEHARYIFEPPPTRVSADGHVEDVPAAGIDAARENASEAALEDSAAGSGETDDGPGGDSTGENRMSENHTAENHTSQDRPNENHTNVNSRYDYRANEYCVNEYRVNQNHTPPPACAGTPPRERRGEALPVLEPRTEAPAPRAPGNPPADEEQARGGTPA